MRPMVQVSEGRWWPAAQIRRQGWQWGASKCMRSVAATAAPQLFYYLGPKQAGTRLWGQPDAATAPAWASVITDKSSTPASSPHQVPPASWLRAAAIIIKESTCSSLHSVHEAVLVCEATKLRNLSLTLAICMFQSSMRRLGRPATTTSACCQKIPGTLCVRCSWRAARCSIEGPALAQQPRLFQGVIRASSEVDRGQRRIRGDAADLRCHVPFAWSWGQFARIKGHGGTERLFDLAVFCLAQRPD
jgi:hypothetical protein